MKVENETADESIQVKNSTRRIVGVCPPAELATTLCTHDMMSQILREVIAPPSNGNVSSQTIETEQMTEVS